MQCYAVNFVILLLIMPTLPQASRLLVPKPKAGSQKLVLFGWGTNELRRLLVLGSSRRLLADDSMLCSETNPGLTGQQGSSRRRRRIPA